MSCRQGIPHPISVHKWGGDAHDIDLKWQHGHLGVIMITAAFVYVSCGVGIHAYSSLDEERRLNSGFGPKLILSKSKLISSQECTKCASLPPAKCSPAPILDGTGAKTGGSELGIQNLNCIGCFNEKQCNVSFLDL